MNHPKKLQPIQRCFVVIMLGLWVGGTAQAAVEDDIQALQAQLLAVTARLEQLERSNSELLASNQALAQENAQQETAVAALEEQARTTGEQLAASTAASWTNTLHWQGDFRYRYENLARQGAEDRNRNRIRARAALVANISDDIEVGIGLASGDSDPVSTNQTLGGGGTTKSLGLDLAYFEWTGLPNTRITGGKFKQIIYTAAKNQLLWDGDWRPEGVGFRWDGDVFFASGQGTWIEGDSNRGTNFSWITQAGVKLAIGDASKLIAGLGYHQVDTAGRSSILGNADFQGNSFDPVTDTYLYNYEGIQAFAEINTSVFDLPLVVYGEYVQNQDAPQFDTGYLAGAILGSAKAQGSWNVGWYYEDLERDAALGLLADSDFGLGGTDARGHVVKATYVIKQNYSAQFAYYMTEVGADQGEPLDVDRMQLDLNFKF
jgi:hypothetical protein